MPPRQAVVGGMVPIYLPGSRSPIMIPRAMQNQFMQDYSNTYNKGSVSRYPGRSLLGSGLFTRGQRAGHTAYAVDPRFQRQLQQRYGNQRTRLNPYYNRMNQAQARVRNLQSNPVIRTGPVGSSNRPRQLQKSQQELARLQMQNRRQEQRQQRQLATDTKQLKKELRGSAVTSNLPVQTRKYNPGEAPGQPKFMKRRQIPRSTVPKQVDNAIKRVV